MNKRRSFEIALTAFFVFLNMEQKEKGVFIRRAEAREDEWVRIRGLAARTWWHTYDGVHPKAQLDYMFEQKYALAEMERLVTQEGHVFYVASVDGTDAGFASCWVTADGTSCELERLYVVPEMHRHGVGRALCDRVVQTAREHGCMRVTLTVNRINSAVQFYERYGFVKTSSFDADIGHGWQINGFRMTLDLTKPR